MVRDRILDEIRLTTARNGGKPLGRRRFEHVTGIGESDWYGRFWARWSDAVMEAGFEPNTKQEPYDRTYVVRHLIKMIEDLGKWPTEAERRMYIRDREGFPSHNTFRNLGGVADQAAAVLTLAGDLMVSDAVLEICTAVAAEQGMQGADSPLPEERGFVYLLRSGRHYKIGRSNDPARRAYEVRLRMPEPVKEVHRIPTDDPEGIEAYWHQRFAEKRVGGEWFRLDRKDVTEFKSRKSM